MAKLLVTDKDGTNPTPFLRGILTSSLQGVGLGFAEAYEFATSVRQDLSEKDTIDRGSLRQIVAKRLKRSSGADVAKRYLEEEGGAESITVRDGSGEEKPFSRSLSAQDSANLWSRQRSGQRQHCGNLPAVAAPACVQYRLR